MRRAGFFFPASSIGLKLVIWILVVMVSVGEASPRRVTSRLVDLPLAARHPYQIVILSPAEADGANLSLQGQQRASYLSEFLLYQNPDGYAINQSVSTSINQFFIPNDGNGVVAQQTITPLFHQANALWIERNTQGLLPINNSYTLANSAKVLKDILFGSQSIPSVGRTLVICWPADNINLNPDGLFGDVDVQTYFQNILADFAQLGTDPTFVGIIDWSAGDTPRFQLIKQIGINGFNTP